MNDDVAIQMIKKFGKIGGISAEAKKNRNGSVPVYSFGSGASGVNPIMMIPNGK